MDEFIKLKQFCQDVTPSDDRLTEETEEYALQWWVVADTVIPRLTKIIRSGITFVSRNIR